MRSRKSAEKLAAEEAAVMSQLSDKKLDLDTFVTRLAQKLIVPSTFGLFALLLSYIVIGLTSSFDSVRDFAFYTGILTLFINISQHLKIDIKGPPFLYLSDWLFTRSFRSGDILHAMSVSQLKTSG